MHCNASKFNDKAPIKYHHELDYYLILIFYFFRCVALHTVFFQKKRRPNGEYHFRPLHLSLFVRTTEQ